MEGVCLCPQPSFYSPYLTPAAFRSRAPNINAGSTPKMLNKSVLTLYISKVPNNQKNIFAQIIANFFTTIQNACSFWHVIQ